MTAHFPDGPAPRGPKWIPLHDLHAQIRAAIRARHYSPRTGKVYLGWIRRFIQFHGRQHPLRLGEREISEFLSHLATRSRVSPSTQNQALSAILFLYRNVLHKGLDRLTDIVRAKPAKRLPVVLTRQEVSAVLRQLSGTQLIMATLLYGAGLRVLECVRLRVKDIDLGTNTIIVRSGKGMKDRKTLLPQRIRGPLHQHLERMNQQHQEDIRQGGGWVELPTAVARRNNCAGTATMNRHCSARSSSPYFGRASPNPPRATR
jgi:site-specific recombinase XerD